MLHQWGSVSLGQQEFDWIQPTLTSNGIVGEDDFAVFADSSGNTNCEYYPFNNSSWLGLTTRPQHWGFYSKTPLKISAVQWLNNDGRNYNITGGTFQGSNDNSNWIDLATIDRVTTASAIRTLTISNSSYFTYFRFEITSSYHDSNTQNYCLIRNISITAKYQVDVSNLIVFPIIFTNTNYSATVSFQGGNSGKAYITNKTISQMELYSYQAEIGNWLATGY